MRLPDLPLFTAPPASGPGTSRQAAQSVERAAPRLRGLVLDAIRSAGILGACEHELDARLGLAGSTVRPRIWELRQQGLVEDSGLRRNTPSGRKAVAWRARS